MRQVRFKGQMTKWAWKTLPTQYNDDEEGRHAAMVATVAVSQAFAALWPKHTFEVETFTEDGEPATTMQLTEWRTAPAVKQQASARLDFSENCANCGVAGARNWSLWTGKVLCDACWKRLNSSNLPVDLGTMAAAMRRLEDELVRLKEHVMQTFSLMNDGLQIIFKQLGLDKLDDDQWAELKRAIQTPQPLGRAKNTGPEATLNIKIDAQSTPGTLPQGPNMLNGGLMLTCPNCGGVNGHLPACPRRFGVG